MGDNHPISDEAISKDFPMFCNLLRSRLQVGANIYGDASFKDEASKTIHELSQEALDIVGWGFILWFKLQQLERKVSQYEQK